MPDALVKYHYRKIFGLTAQELEAEPIDQFYTNFYIHAEILEKQRIEANHGSNG